MKDFTARVYNSNEEIYECIITASNEYSAFCKLIDKYNQSGLYGAIIRTEVSEKRG